jgi:uncharacterized protein (DUF2344 family)
LQNEKKRILLHPDERTEWKADSLTSLSETPLLLHPEIDDPEEHIEVSATGELVKKNNSIKGESTINICKLNRDALILSRKAIIDNFAKELMKAATYIRQGIKEKRVTKKNFITEIENVFSKLFNLLNEKRSRKKELSIVARCMLKKFNLFFIQSLPEGDQKGIITIAFKIFTTADNKTEV